MLTPCIQSKNVVEDGCLGRKLIEMSILKLISFYIYTRRTPNHLGLNVKANPAEKMMMERIWQMQSRMPTASRIDNYNNWIQSSQSLTQFHVFWKLWPTRIFRLRKSLVKSWSASISTKCYSKKCVLNMIHAFFLLHPPPPTSVLLIAALNNTQ